MPQDLARPLEDAIAAAAPRLRSLFDAVTAEKASPDKWSRKEELGRLIDSATNNHVRFVRGSLEAEYRGPSYDGDGWVRLHGYRDMRWPDLIDFWERYNSFLVQVVRQIPDSALDKTCVVGEYPPMTLGALIAEWTAGTARRKRAM